MCFDPITLGGVLLTGASLGANALGAQRTAAARSDAQQAEARRQAAYDAEIADLNTGMIDRYGKAKKGQKERKAELTDLFTKQSAEIPAGLTGAPAATGDIITQQGKQQQKATGKELAKRGEQRADLRSLGDVFGDLGLRSARDANQIGILGGFKQGSSAILPYELEAANQAGAGFQLAGDVLGGLGSLGLSAGLSGATLPFFGGSSLAPATAGALPVPRPGLPPAPITPRLPVPRPVSSLAGLY